MFFVNVQAAIYENHKWLLIKRSEQEEHAAGQLALVGGTVDQELRAEKTLEATLKREVDEEIGIEIDNLRYVNSSSFTTDSGEAVINVVFLCERRSGIPYMKSVDEVDAILWQSTEEILRNPNIPLYLKKDITEARKLIKEEKVI
ncbi:NUDIX domain-containing protein [Priestia koreensis]|uniref:DNA mismatch repair protein MutT n=1 Tax=Priestia koreensis TaxID=284581 RepID=A0A0M0L5V4_9BACI|nr:NUDIX domain-containing protein [Priestia koreensis]KOO46043.1 DNA mismatch repair protein MutT [Priestia koreensis]